MRRTKRIKVPKYGTIPEFKLASEYSKRPDIRAAVSERWTWPKRRKEGVSVGAAS